MIFAKNKIKKKTNYECDEISEGDKILPDTKTLFNKVCTVSFMIV